MQTPSDSISKWHWFIDHILPKLQTAAGWLIVAGLLTATLIPAISRAQSAVKITQCKLKLSNLYKCVMMYSDTSLEDGGGDGMYPHIAGATKPEQPLQLLVNGGFIRDPKQLMCPSYTKPGTKVVKEDLAIARNHQLALVYLELIRMMQQGFKKFKFKPGKKGTFLYGTLEELSKAHLLHPNFATKPVSGYKYQLILLKGGSGFTAKATPISPKHGKKLFVVSDDFRAVDQKGLKKLKLQAMYSSTIGSLRTIVTAQQQFRILRKKMSTAFPCYGTFAELAKAEFLDKSFVTGKRYGFTYKMVLKPKATPTQFHVIASPISPANGTRKFYVDSGGRVTFTEDGSTPSGKSRGLYESSSSGKKFKIKRSHYSWTSQALSNEDDDPNIVLSSSRWCRDKGFGKVQNCHFGGFTVLFSTGKVSFIKTSHKSLKGWLKTLLR